MSCGSRSLTPAERALKMVEDKSNFKDDGEKLIVPVHYVVLYTDEQNSNVPLSLIQANHDQLNLDINGKNEDAKLIPTSGPYAKFAAVKGNANIDFTPAVLTEENNVTRIKTTHAPFQQLNDVFTNHPIYMRKIVVYIAPLRSGLLGEAILGQTGVKDRPYTVVANMSLGKEGQEGLYQGRTLTHEMGHVLTLEHPWETQCGLQMYSDIPVTKMQNEVGQLQLGGIDGLRAPEGGQYFGCNKYNDIKMGQNKSCPGNNYELFFQYMEYIGDHSMVMFTKDQVGDMRTWLKTTAPSMIDVVIGEKPTEPTDPLPTDPTEPVNPQPTNPTDPSQPLANNSGMDWWVILLSVIGGVLLISLLVWASIW